MRSGSISGRLNFEAGRIRTHAVDSPLEAGSGGEEPVGRDEGGVADVILLLEQGHVPGPVAWAGHLRQALGRPRLRAHRLDAAGCEQSGMYQVSGCEIVEGDRDG